MATLEQHGSLTVARARRRPARYSPELSANAQQHQSEMVIGALLVNTPEEAAALLLQQELEQQQQEEDEANAEEMAPARRSTKPKTKKKSKKRQNDDGAKRPRVANVLLENEELIDEIRKRKALWMRTHEQHHSSNLTAPLWEDIAKILGTTQENIKRRWKSLKDHYRRELKKSMTDATAPPSTWPYYKKMRFMKSQMFVSLRRKNGEDHLEILSDDEDLNNQWNGHEIRGKQENGSDTMDDYEMAEGYTELIKYEQQMLHNASQEEMEGGQEEEEEELEEEEEDPQQTQQNVEEQEEEQEEQGQEELSPMGSLQDQEEISALQQSQAELSAELSDMTTLQQQPDMSADMSNMTTIAEIGGIPAIVTTTTASSLNGRLSAMQHRASEMQRSGRLSAMQQSHTINGELAEMTARQSALQQQRDEINGRLTAIQRSAEMNALQQRANITALHQRAEMTALQQRAELQQRNGVVDNGVDSANISTMISDDRGGISDDYHFFMSLMPHVRNFTSLQKLKVRNRIQQIIIEEASNCQYNDPLGNC